MSNRSTVKANIITKNVASVSNVILTDIFNNEMADNLRFREDVAVIQNASLSSITVDFTGRDRIDLTRTGGSLNITVSGLDDGDVKYLLITKTAGQHIAFVGVTDVTPVTKYVDSLSKVLYEIVRKGSNYFARAMAETVFQATDTVEGVLEIATASEHNALSSVTKAVVPGRIPISSTSQKGLIERATTTEVVAGDTTRAATGAGVQAAIDDFKGLDGWVSPSLNTGWVQGVVRYFKDPLGIVHVISNSLRNNVTGVGGTPSTIFTLPSGYRPLVDIFFPVNVKQPSTYDLDDCTIEITDAGQVNMIGQPAAYPVNYSINAYFMFRADN